MDVVMEAGSTPPGSTSGRAFEPHRKALHGLAYRMLGDVAAAEDAVQETYLRWHQAQRQDVAEPRAWLLTACARLCIDELRSARARRESYVGPWLPEPLVEPDVPADPVERAESISIAFLLLLESLQPVERAAYVLREVFELGYDEIGRALGKSVEACRQIVSRAARRIAAAERPVRPDAKLTAGFAAALAKGDMAGLVRLLAGEAVLTSDGGGKVISARRPIRGAERIARLLLGIRRKAGEALRIVPATVNGAPGCVLRRGHAVHSVLGFAAADGRIAAVYVMRNPDKLTRVGQATSGLTV
jgi:RNA polymerase sigma-70 factor (ECF subfamily)